MAIYIDSANPDEVKQALDLGWVKGVTTNPLLLAREGTEVEKLLTTLGNLASGSVFYQLVSETFQDMINEAERARAILEDRLVVKLPPTDLGFDVCSQLASRIPCCPTAIYSPAQALVAAEAGVQFIAVYVNRASKLIGDGIGLVRSIAEVLDGTQTEILAASIKSPEEAVDAVKAGAHHLTLPFSTLTQMTGHELSDAAVQEFRSAGKGLSS